MKLARERQYQQFVKETAEQRAKREERQRQKEEEEEEKRLAETHKKVPATPKASNDPIGDPEEFIARKITGKKVVIFSKRMCPYCM